MKALEEFIIPFSGLKQGTHNFDFEINKQFFECFENSEVLDGKVHVNVVLDRKSVLLLFNLKATGNVVVQCDRCGDDFEMPLEGEQKVLAKIGKQTDGEQDDDIVYLEPKDHEINIAQYIYELISLSIPYQRTHPKNKCNKEALKKIKQLNASTPKTKTTDPRWDILKNLN